MEQVKAEGWQNRQSGVQSPGWSRSGFSERVIHSIKPACPLENPHWFFSLPLVPHATDIPVCLNCVCSVSPNMHPFITFILMGKFAIYTLRYQQNFSGIHLCWIEGYLLSENILLKCIWIITGSKQNETVLRGTSGRCEEFIEPYCGNKIVDFQHLTKSAGWWNHSEKCV